MIRTLHCICVASFLAITHLALLLYIPMLGCGFEGTGEGVDDNLDDPNSYICGCTCSTALTRTLRVSAAADDAEQTIATGAVMIVDVDLDLGVDRAGLRFADVRIPPGSVITAAHLQLTADQAFLDDGASPTNLTIFGEAVDDAAPFSATPFNLTTRPQTMATVAWNPPPWSLSESGPAQRSPDLTAIIQEIIDRPGWQAVNGLALQIAGVGRREAETFDENPTAAAVLEIEFLGETVQSLPICMPPAINPNIGANPDVVEGDPRLANDCAGRVDQTLTGLASACNYPSQCACTPRAQPLAFHGACNDPCVEMPLDVDCQNFDPFGTATATNVPGDPAVCIAARAPGEMGPQPLAAHIFGARNLCEVAGQANVRVGDEPEKVTDAQGMLEIVGAPCPAASCAVSIDYRLALDPIKFEVKFAADPVFEDLAAIGSSAPEGVQIGPAGIGEVLAEATDTSIRGRRSSNDAAFVLTNDTAVGLIVNWEDHVCALFGELATTVDSEDPNVETDETLTAEIHVQGPIVNQPPTADAGADHDVECTSSEGAVVVLDGRASGDPDDNIVIFQWFRDSRSGDVIGMDEMVEVPQGLDDASTYVLRVVDTFGQTSEDPIIVRVADTTPPAIECNAPPAITPPGTPVGFMATSMDTCDPEVIPEITGFECFRFTGNGARIDKTHSCGVTFDGAMISIPRSLGIGHHIAWTVRAEDDAGNSREIECEVEVVRQKDA
jgi:hypothetical protein